MAAKKRQQQQIAPALLLATDAQVKAYFHPERQKIVSMLRGTRMTVTQVAKQLGVHPANLTHHFKKLEETGIILLVEKRDIGRNIEKYYLAAAHRFDVKPPAGEVKNVNATVMGILRDDLNQTIPDLVDDSEPAIGLLTAARISTDQFRHFAAKLKDLVTEFTAAHDSGDALYTINVSLYPRKQDFGTTGHIEINKKGPTK